MKARYYCRVNSRGYAIMCGQPARFQVYWTLTAEDAIPCCGKHLTKAVEELQAKTNDGKESSFRVWIVPNL